MADREARRRYVTDALGVAGGAALLVSAVLPWVRRGPGRTLHGHALVDAVIALGNTLPGLSAARLTVLWYLVPASGALVWIALGTFGPRHRATRVTILAALALSIVAFYAFERALGLRALGAGPYVALAGALLAAGGQAADAFGSLRSSSDATSSGGTGREKQ